MTLAGRVKVDDNILKNLLPSPARGYREREQDWVPVESRFMALSQWPANWSSNLTDEHRGRLESELARELSATHALYGHVWTAVAVLIRDTDWVALQLDDGRFAAVHLTWRVESDPLWPHTSVYESLEELCEPANWE